MTMNDLLHLILAAADDVGRVFDHAEIVTWPAGAHGVLCRLGLLRPAAAGLFAPCPNCQGAHIEAVTIRPGAGEADRYFIWCPDAMRVEVHPEMCAGWEVDRANLASAVAVAMGITQRPKAVVSERFWRLGRTPWPPGTSHTREIALAMRMRDLDASNVAANVGAGGRTIVLVPQHAPDDRIWSDPAPAVVPLAEVLSLVDGELVLDTSAVVEIVQSADLRAEKANAIALGPTGKKMVRRQVKAEIKSLLTDDAYVAAYKEHGSYRDAAEALTRQTGRPVSKDAVYRAVQRHGGQAGTVEEEDSPSVARGVASQRRDRAKKIVERR